VSFGIPAALLFGLILILASLALFLTSRFKPDLYQESDNIYAVIGIVCGLLLLISLDLGAAMAFQQLLMIGAVISIMWQFMQVRAENKRLKGEGRSAAPSRSRETANNRRSAYNARLDDEPEYSPPSRDRRFREERNDRQFQPSSYEEEYAMPEERRGRMLPQYDRAEQPDDWEQPRRDGAKPTSRGRAYDAAPNGDDWQTAPPAGRDSRSNDNRSNNDWDRPERSRRSARGGSNNPPARQRRSSLSDSADEPAAKSTAYVDYEPIEPDGTDSTPVQFPGQY
jgi:hypothetical protein